MCAGSRFAVRAGGDLAPGLPAESTFSAAGGASVRRGDCDRFRGFFLDSGRGPAAGLGWRFIGGGLKRAAQDLVLSHVGQADRHAGKMDRQSPSPAGRGPQGSDLEYGTYRSPSARTRTTAGRPDRDPWADGPPRFLTGRRRQVRTGVMAATAMRRWCGSYERPPVGRSPPPRAVGAVAPADYRSPRQPGALQRMRGRPAGP